MVQTEVSAARAHEDEKLISSSPLARGIALLASGQVRAALDAASDACHAEPARPEAHYLYGQVWAALGEHARAGRAFAEALRLNPDWADAWVNFGLACYQRGAMEDAKAAMDQALRRDPANRAAAANLGAFLRLTGSAEDGEALLREVLAADVDNVAARLNLAADLLQDERSDEALALLEEVSPPEDPLALRHYHLARALAHLQERRPVEGRLALDAVSALGPVPAALAPLWHWRRLLLALVEDDQQGAGAEAEAAEAALGMMGPDAVPEHRIMMHFDLAKFWSGAGRHARAFGHWTAAHRLLADSQPFSREAHRSFVDAAVATFTTGRFAAGPRASNRDPAPVFIVGMPRSGTTLCEQILAAHADVHGAGERPALGRAFHALAGDETPESIARLEALDAAALDRAADHYLADLHALAPGASRIVDKMPGNYLHLGLVGLLLPGARIIHCTRDPRDIGLSIFTFRFHGPHPYAHDLGDLGWTIRQQERLMAHWKAALPNPVLSVALSDWVEDFDGTLARVLAHLDLPPDPACVRFYESDSRVRTVSRSQVRQPINARGLGRWRAYAKQLAPLITELGIGDIGAVGPSESDPGSRSPLHILSVKDPARALGLVTNYLMSKPVFARLDFGHWTHNLSAQIERGHYRLFADDDGRIRGFFGWALADRISAEDWLSGRRLLNSTDCRFGDCVIFNAWAADTPVVHRFMTNEMRRVAENSTMLFYRRFYPDGRVRAVRLPSTKFLPSHIDRAAVGQA